MAQRVPRVSPSPPTSSNLYKNSLGCQPSEFLSAFGTPFGTPREGRPVAERSEAAGSLGDTMWCSCA